MSERERGREREGEMEGERERERDVENKYSIRLILVSAEVLEQKSGL